MKKICTFILLFMFLITSSAFAATSSSKSFAPSRPSAGSSYHPSNSPQTNYKPSAPAKSYNEKAPQTANKQQPFNQQNSGGFWHNFGMFGSGLLVGSLFSHMFGGYGYGMGFMNPLFNILANIIFLAALFFVVRYIWRKLRGNRYR